MPNHLNLPLLADVLVVGGEEVVEVVEVFKVVAAVPGRHWLYQSFW